MSEQPPIGIDLGTTFSVLSYLDPDGRPVSVPNAEGDLTTPSVIFFDGIDVVVGKEALKAATIEPENVAQFAKRDMGSEYFSKTIHGEQLPPEVIQSFVLQKLKHDAALKIGPVEKVVITVPAFFNEPRRKATQDAGALAGLKVLDIINEPTAAAIAYGVQEGFLAEDASSRQKENILVYDLGGGTFDVTLMSIDGRNYHAIATAGDVYLGGIDWDRRVVDYITEEFLKKYPGEDPREHPGGLQRLLRDAEDAKRALTSRTSTTIMFEHHGQAVRVPLTREKFDDLTRDLLERTRFTTLHVLREGKLEWSDITRVLLVGGSTRMVQVGEMLKAEWGQEPDRSLSADEAVAHGAAIYAGLLQDMASGKDPKANVVNVNSHDLAVLGTEKLTGRPRKSVLIPRNTPLPVKSKGSYSTAKDNQTSVAVRVIEGGDASGNHSTPIGKCVIQDLPSNLPGGTPVEVLFTYGSDGRLTVQARLPTLNRSASLEIQRASGLTGDQLRDWQRRLNSGGPLTFQ